MLKTRKKISSSELIQEKLNKGHEIRPFPRVVSQLLSALKDPSVRPETLAKIIESDVALSTRILRMANSPIYGFSNVIQSIEHATSILGINPLKNLALTFAGSTMFKGGDQKQMEIQESLWNHSLGCATTARILATTVGKVAADDAFLAGIFHDVGKLFFHDVVPDEYAKMTEVAWGEELIKLELEQFETTHAEVGAKLVTSWQLPEQIAVAVGNHHQPLEAIAHKELTAITSIADLTARAGGVGSKVDEEIDVLTPISVEVLKLGEHTMQTIQEQALEVYEKTQQAYSN